MSSTRSSTKAKKARVSAVGDDPPKSASRGSKLETNVSGPEPTVDQLCPHVKAHLKDETVAVNRTGVRRRLNVLVATSRFNSMEGSGREAALRKLIEAAPISEIEKARVGFALALGTDDFI